MSSPMAGGGLEDTVLNSWDSMQDCQPPFGSDPEAPPSLTQIQDSMEQEALIHRTASADSIPLGQHSPVRFEDVFPDLKGQPDQPTPTPE
eukprot:6382966-Alexandrium_andersonii.AAC.1